MTWLVLLNWRHTVTTMNAEEETYDLHNVKEYLVITGTTRK